MPKLSKSVPKYGLHKPSGRARVVIDGRHHYLGPYNSSESKAEYDRLVAEWLSTGRRSVVSEVKHQLTVVELISAYWKFAEGYYRKGGKATSELSVIKLALRDLKSLYGRQPANQFGPLKLKALREHWISNGHARKTINDQVGRVKRMFRWGCSEELVNPETYHALASVQGLAAGRSEARETEPVQPVPDATVSATLPFLSQVLQDMIRLQMLSGARPGEICRLRPQDLDRSADVWIYTVRGHKTEHHKKCRKVFLGPECQKVLLPYLLRDATVPCFSPKESDQQIRDQRESNRTTPLNSGNRRGTNRKRSPKRKPGDQFTTASYGRAIARACDKAFPAPAQLACQENESNRARLRRLDRKQLAALQEWQKRHRWAPNQLRHAAGTRVRQMFDLESARIVLGHTIASMSEVYALEDQEKGFDVARRIG